MNRQSRSAPSVRLLPASALAALLGSALGISVSLPAGAVSADDYSGCAGTVAERTLDAGPATYQALLGTLQPGDLLRLAPGTYPNGLSLHGVVGAPGRCIVIEGPSTGAPALFTGRDCCNTVSLADSAYLVLRHLSIDGQGRAGDAVKAESTATSVHHVTLEHLSITGVDADQQIVGINTKCPAWNWVVRFVSIDGAGTGMYFGDSNGDEELVHSLIEHNLVQNTLGYSLQIKHQNGRSTGLGMPATGTTILRHNVFSKASGSADGGAARPNVLIGHRPLSGDGADDDTVVYGNFFHQNPTEALFQGEGHLILYDNLFLNDVGPAVHIQPHNDVPKRVRVFQNTVLASTGATVLVTGADPSFDQDVVANATFGSPPSGGTQSDNVGDTYANAGSYLRNPDGEVTGASDRLDLAPLVGQLTGAAVGLGPFATWPDFDRDFDGRARGGTFRGAYAVAGEHDGWLPTLGFKPDEGPIFADGFESGDLLAWASP